MPVGVTGRGQCMHGQAKDSAELAVASPQRNCFPGSIPAGLGLSM